MTDEKACSWEEKTELPVWQTIVEQRSKYNNLGRQNGMHLVGEGWQYSQLSIQYCMQLVGETIWHAAIWAKIKNSQLDTQLVGVKSKFSENSQSPCLKWYRLACAMIFGCCGAKKSRQFWQTGNEDEQEVTSEKRGCYYDWKNQTKLTSH